MTFNGWLQIVMFFAVIVAITKPLGAYMFRVFEGDASSRCRARSGGSSAARGCGLRAPKQQTWVQYTIAMLVFSAIGIVVTYLIQRTCGRAAVEPAAPAECRRGARVTHRVELRDQHELAVVRPRGDDELPRRWPLGVAQLHVGGRRHRRRARGRAQPGSWQPGPDGAKGVGNFYVDLIRGIVYVLLPICILVALVLVSQGVIQSLAGYHAVTTLEGGSLIAMGPVASQEAIKEPAPTAAGSSTRPSPTP